MESRIEKRLGLFPDTVQITATADGDYLAIGGCNLSTLADLYGTPLYVYDRATMDRAVATYRDALAAHYPGVAGITYAGKAYLCTAVAQWVKQVELHLDCSSEGELHIAQSVGVQRGRIVVHGVNKSAGLLAAALDGAGTLVVDSVEELTRMTTRQLGTAFAVPDLWLRYRPGIPISTHSYVQTGQAESKFGMDEVEIQQAAGICQRLGPGPRGLHFHLGSQIRDLAPIGNALEHTLDLAVELGLVDPWALCAGGGLGVSYHEDDLPHPDIEAAVRLIAERVIAGCAQRRLSLPSLFLEPGRSVIARAGVALYRVGGVKLSGDRRWLLLDGGLADNPRPALYGTRYSALPVRAPHRPAYEPTWLAGPYCESGDVLIEALPLPTIQPGELVAIPMSGAYQLSMASNYNASYRPAVLWLEGGVAQLIQHREQGRDLLRRDAWLKTTDG